jgi:hypothetical protein
MDAKSGQILDFGAAERLQSKEEYETFGQFACGIITISQFGIGVVSICQFTIAEFALAQFALGYSIVAPIGLFINSGRGPLVSSIAKLLGI